MNAHNRPNKPTTLLIHGANFVGQQLASLLATQKGNIIVLDEFTRETRDVLKKLKHDNQAETFDLSSLPTISQDLKRVDYILILLDQYLRLNPHVSSKTFLSETNIIDAACKLAIEQGAKVVLTTSIALHRKIVSAVADKTDSLRDMSSQQPYTPAELQRYCENLAAEYHDQATLNIRIVRLGETIGEGMPVDDRTTFVQMVKESITKPRITIPGEGLDYAFYVHSLDAVYGIIKSLFSSKTDGEVFSLSYPEEISSLNLAYKILELNPRAGEIAFGSPLPDALPQHQYIPAKNLTKLGWTPKIPFEQALLETMTYFHKQYNVVWKDMPSLEKKSVLNYESEPARDTPETEPTVKTATTPRSDVITPFGKLLQTVASPFVKARSTIQTTAGQMTSTITSPRRIGLLAVKVLTLIIVYIVFIGPIFQLLIGGVGAYYYGKKGYGEALALDTTHAQISLHKTASFADLLQSGWAGLGWLKYIPPVTSFYNETAQLLSGTSHLAQGGDYLVQGLEPYATYVKDFQPATSFGVTAGGGSRTYLEELEAMDQGWHMIESASVEISLARESLAGIRTSSYPAFVAEPLKKLIDKAETAAASVSTIESFAYYLPELLGKDGRQTYIVLFQNPMELRSTGGWLSSVAIVGVEYGQIRELEVKDVYDIDGRITDHVDPPESMRNALNVQDWTLSLSNWSPDFPQSAESAEYFLNLSGDAASIDGVIAVDLEFVRSMIDVWGQVIVPGESTPVTSDSLYEKVIEIHREFSPGSTRKPVFLSNLSNEILHNILSSPRDQWPKIGSTIAEGLDEKHILVYVHNTEVDEVLDTNHWSGHIESSRNTLFPVEWNWGGNKANYYIDRSINIQTNILSGNAVQQTLTITYQNTSTVNAYPEGPYENYLRVYIPANAKVTRVEGISTVSVNQDTGFGLDMVTGWVTVPVNSRKVIVIAYQLTRDEVDQFPLYLESDDRVTYELNYIKQPGLNADPVTIEVTYPSEWTPEDLTDVRRELNALITRTELISDIAFSISWEQ